MPEILDIESDEFLKLLTDALRAGPGSPEWRQAVQQLKGNKDRRDEYTLLCQAREHLESGKAYRSVVAGPGFTKKVLDGIEDEDPVETKLQVPPTANLVAILSGVVLIVVVGVIAYFLVPGTDPNRAALDDLDKVYFGTATATTFQGGIPDGWRTIGPLPLDTKNNLKPAPTTQPLPAGTYRGGGVVTWTPLPPGEPVAIEVSVSATQLSDEISAQLFVADDPSFSEDRATAAHELVWSLQGNQPMVVLPSGRIASTGEKMKPSTEPFTVRLVINRDLAMIDVSGTRLWAGPHQLSPEKQRYVGVRFVRSGSKPSPISFASIRIQKPQTTR